MGCDRQCRVLEWGPHPRDYKTLAPRCKSETYSILPSAVNFDILMECFIHWRVLEWGPHPRDYKTLSPRCKSETYSILCSAINLISCPNFSISYVFLTYLWCLLFTGGYSSEGHTQGITRLYHLDVSLRPIPYCVVPSTWFPVHISALHINFWHTYGVL